MIGPPEGADTVRADLTWGWPTDTPPRLPDDTDVAALIRADMRLAYAVHSEVHPALIGDHRPWVPTHLQAHEPIYWGDGYGCGHPDCDPSAGRNLRATLT